MNTTTVIESLADECRDALSGFWKEQLAVETGRSAITLALPLMYPDGLQVVLTLTPITATQAVVSDIGHTLGNLSCIGMNFEAQAKQTHALLEQRLQAFEIRRDGFELRKAIKLPIEGIDLHLFGEALVSIAHLLFRHEPDSSFESAALRTVRKVFADRNIEPLSNYLLPGRIEKRIKVDFFWAGTRPVAIEVIKRRDANLSYMEQWAWRWTDLRNKNENLVRAMVYDPDVQSFDESSFEIARSVCELFCPYFETAQIHGLLEKAS